MKLSKNDVLLNELKFNELNMTPDEYLIYLKLLKNIIDIKINDLKKDKK